MIISSIVFILYSFGKLSIFWEIFIKKGVSSWDIFRFHGKGIQVFVYFFLQSKLYPRDDFSTATNCLPWEFCVLLHLPEAHSSVLNVCSFSIPSGLELKKKKVKWYITYQTKPNQTRPQTKHFEVHWASCTILEVRYSHPDYKHSVVRQTQYSHTSTIKGLTTVSFRTRAGTFATSLPHSSADCKASAVAVKFTSPGRENFDGFKWWYSG